MTAIRIPFEGASVLVSTLQTPIKTRGSVCKVRTQATDIRITIDIRVHGQPTNKRLLKVDRVLTCEDVNATSTSTSHLMTLFPLVLGLDA